MAPTQSKRIKLFITDIDGCLLEAMKTPDWNTLGRIKWLNGQSAEQEDIPSLTICTGRPMPYAEAVAQWMGISLPIIFENAGVFNLDGYRIDVNGSFNKDDEQQIISLKEWLKKEIIPQHDGMVLEFSKLMDAGLIHPEKEVIQQALPDIQEHVEDNYEGFEVHDTDISINIILTSNNKRIGIEKLCNLQGVKPDEVAYIGDSGGDIPGLKYVGRPFAPKNANESVKQVASVINKPSTQAVLTAYEQIIKENKSA